MYAKCGSVSDAHQVFDKMPERDIFTWNTMMAGYAKHGCGREALEIYEQMQLKAVTPDTVTFTCVLNACASLGSLERGKMIHADIIIAGLPSHVILDTALVAMYAKCSGIKDARQVFDNMSQRNVVSWNAMITGYAQNGCDKEALEVYDQMAREGVTANRVTFISVLNACASPAYQERGRGVHNDIDKAGIVLDIILGTAIVNMYAKCGILKEARRVFNNMAQHNVVSWSALIAGYAQHGCCKEGLEMYDQMTGEGVTPNAVTFISVLKACAGLAALEKGIEVHTAIIKAGSLPNIVVENTLIDMYVKCGSIKAACKVFNNIAKRNVVSWSAMIAGYAQHGYSMEALEMYKQLIREGITPDKVTFICVLNACAGLAALEKGKEIHADIIKAGLVPDVILETTLVHMYPKCGSVKDAREVFDNMAERDVVAWNAMIAGYAHHGCGVEAFNIYKQMIQERMMPDKVTFISILNACANLAALEKGKDVHAAIIKSQIMPDIALENTIMDMYAKCGSVEDAHLVFDSMAERDVVSWNAIIAGYAQHGCGREALQLFEYMQQEGLMPNSVTFTCVLSACSHTGLVDEGNHYFDSMSQDNFLAPTVEHFGCMVDLFGRAGRVDEAEELINKMPFEPALAVWGALLAACRIHGNVKVAERAAKHILRWDPHDAATYVLLSNIYAVAGRRDLTVKVRKMMDRGVGMEPGRSCIEVNYNGHTFFADDKSHPPIEQIHAEL